MTELFRTLHSEGTMIRPMVYPNRLPNSQHAIETEASAVPDLGIWHLGVGLAGARRSRGWSHTGHRGCCVRHHNGNADH